MKNLNSFYSSEDIWLLSAKVRNKAAAFINSLRNRKAPYIHICCYIFLIINDLALYKERYNSVIFCNAVSNRTSAFSPLVPGAVPANLREISKGLLLWQRLRSHMQAYPKRNTRDGRAKSRTALLSMYGLLSETNVCNNYFFNHSPLMANDAINERSEKSLARNRILVWTTFAFLLIERKERKRIFLFKQKQSVR